MSKPIVRVFKTEKQAQSAVDGLVEGGFAKRDILVVAPPAAAKEGEPAAGPDLAAVMRAGEMLGAHADIYAGEMQKGHTIVAVTPAFGNAYRAEVILESNKGINVGPPETPPNAWKKGDLLSDFFGIPTKAKNPRSLTGLLGPEISQTKVWFSYVFGLDLLSRNPAPLSSLFGFSTLKRTKADRNTSMGFSILSKKPYTFGSDPLMRDKPAPLSSIFNLPLLTGRR